VAFCQRYQRHADTAALPTWWLRVSAWRRAGTGAAVGVPPAGVPPSCH
jgi:hypothetical protein